jgi:hypothetical protein
MKQNSMNKMSIERWSVHFDDVALVGFEKLGFISTCVATTLTK